MLTLKNRFFFCFLTILFFSCGSGSNEFIPDAPIPNASDKKTELTIEDCEKILDSQFPHSKIEQYSDEDFEALLNDKSGNITVFYFWATWCKECVDNLKTYDRFAAEVIQEELERQKDDESGAEKSKIIIKLVNLNGTDNRVVQVKDCVKKKGVKLPIAIVNESAAQKPLNELVDGEWNGSWPVTLISNPSAKVRMFYEGNYNSEELAALVNPFRFGN